MITINSTTKLSTIIRANKDSIEAIASLSNELARLRNPILRKVMASRITIAEAAEIGGCTTEQCKRALIPLGFKWEEEPETDSSAPSSAQGTAFPPHTLHPAFPSHTLIEFDVRPIIWSNSDPLKAILEKYRALKPGETLCIINSFVPTPLIRLLEKEGASVSTETISPSEYRTYFTPASILPPMPTEQTIFFDTAEQFAAACAPYTPIEIDVRPLESPLPMQTILANLAQLPRGSALYVFHKRVPLPLLEHLENDPAHYEIHILTLAENNVRVLFIKP
ncbi:MAG: DUF2249 domain-containing protein [Bacteroidetes bacterium]|nr:DUF2249 domain-containing protein [Bacteroidota bacterium]